MMTSITRILYKHMDCLLVNDQVAIAWCNFFSTFLAGTIKCLHLCSFRWRQRSLTHRAATCLVHTPTGSSARGRCLLLPLRVFLKQQPKRSLPASFLGPGWSELFPGLESHLLTLMIQFCIPGHRELVYWFVFSWQKLVCTGLSKSRTRIYMHLLFCPIKKTCIFWFVYIFVRNLYICFGIFLTSCFPNQDAAPY